MNSLRIRLLLLSAVLLSLFSYFTYLSLNKAFFSNALFSEEEKLKGLVYSILGSLDETKEGKIVLNELSIQDQRFLAKNSGLFAQVIAGNGAVIWRSPSLSDPRIFPSTQVDTGQWLFTPANLGDSNGVFRLGFGVTWVMDQGSVLPFTVFIAEDTKAFGMELQRYHEALTRWLSLTALVLFVSLLLVLQWGLSPLRKMARELLRLKSGEQETIDAAYPVELVPMREGINELLRHERAQQKRYRNALDDLAHSLKTPLAALRNLSGGKMTEQIEQIDKILDYQVRRASTAGRQVFVKPVLVRSLVERTTSALSKVHHQKKIQFQMEIDPQFSLSIDEGDLMEVFGNLLENAAKWCKRKIVVSAQDDPAEVIFSVEDDGEGFPKEGREHLAERGVRADERFEGQGIGLAVVYNIVSMYEGKLELQDGRLGGAKVVVRLAK